MKNFALDLGNKQTKLKSEKNEYVLPSRFLNQAYAPKNAGKKANKDIHSFKVPFNSETYLWGQDVNNLHLDDYIEDTIMYDNRYSSESFKLLANFALGELAKDFEESKKGILDISVTLGLPTGDYENEDNLKELEDVFSGQHQVELDGETYNVKVKKINVLPQPIGTLYSELLDKEGNVKNPDLQEEKVGIIDVGGGTILIDTVLDFELSYKNRKQFDTGINDLYENIMNNIKNETSIYQIEHLIRKGLNDDTYTYEFSKNNIQDITSIVLSERDRFTKRLITQIKSTLKNLNSIDTLIFTGGGANLINKKMINEEFSNAILVSNTEFANVRGFYLFGSNVLDQD